MRRYSKELVDEMRRLQEHGVVEGVDALFKPVPDAPGRHVLDPRIVEVIERKRLLFESRGSLGCSLSFERNRPDKVTYDLTEAAVRCEEHLVEIDGDHMVDAYTYAPAAPGCARPMLVYVHGGGFTSGCERLFHHQMRFIAEQADAVVVFPEYRLAPECPFPGAIDDVRGVLTWAVEHASELGAAPGRVMLAGDSAGGSLACACMQLGCASLVQRLMLVYPASDKSDYRTQRAYTWSYDAYEIEAGQEELMRSRIERIKRGVECDPDGLHSLYLQGRTTSDDPLVSAVFASDEALARFPETVFALAEYDYLRLGAEYLAKRMVVLGVRVRLMRYLGCDHGFLDLFGTCPQAEELCLTIADELRCL